MSEHNKPDSHLAGKPTPQARAANNPGLSGGEPPAGAEGQCETEETTKEQMRQTRPNIPYIPDIRAMINRRRFVYTYEEKEKAWEKVASMTLYHNDAMVDRWNKEIDTYLVFAGLFSAVLTAFNVQSYILLQPAAPDPSLAVLQQMSAQLASFSIHPPFVNSTNHPWGSDSSSTNIPPPVPRWAVWLNALWFSSLILSLSSASIGILVKQWLSENTSDSSGTSRDITRKRKYRLDNLVQWHVEDIIDIIPVLLQSAVALFLAGLLVLLWTLHHGVAALSAVLITILAVFTISTTILPLFKPRCAYVSPPTRYVYNFWQPKRLAYWMCVSMTSGRYTMTEVFQAAQRRLCTLCRHLRLSFSLTHWRSLWGRARYTTRKLRSTFSPPEAWKERKQTWQGRERSTIDRSARDLDKQTLVEAYSSTLHPDALSAASVCLMDFDADDVVDYFQKLHKSAREHFGPAADSERGPLGIGNRQKLLWLHIILCILSSDSSRLSGDEVAALSVYFNWGSWSSGMQGNDAEWAVSICNAISDHLETEGPSSALKFIDQGQIEEERGYLIGRAMRREKPLTSVLLPGVTGAYREVRLSRSHLAEARSNDTKDAHTRYLRSVADFLVCANHALKSSLPAKDLKPVRAYTGDVLAELTHVLLQIFAADKTQFVQTTVDARDLLDIMEILARNVSDGVLQCISDDLRIDILRMTDALAKPYDYADDQWNYGDRIPRYSRHLKAKIIRIKGEPVIETKLGESPADRSGTEASASSNLAVSPHSAVEDRLSGALRHPGDGLPEPHASPLETVSS